MTLAIHSFSLILIFFFSINNDVPSVILYVHFFFPIYILVIENIKFYFSNECSWQPTICAESTRVSSTLTHWLVRNLIRAGPSDFWSYCPLFISKAKNFEQFLKALIARSIPVANLFSNKLNNIPISLKKKEKITKIELRIGKMANLTLGRSHKFQPSTKQRVIFHVQNSKKKKERERKSSYNQPTRPNGTYSVVQGSQKSQSEPGYQLPNTGVLLQSMIHSLPNS